VNVHYLNGTDSGSDVYLGGKCKGGFGDVRFTAMDGVTLLPYWMETPISDNATFWVKVSDNLSTQSAIIYLYYGNPAANSTSNGTATFDFYDDFSTDTGWTLNGASISCGTLNLDIPNGNSFTYAQKNNSNTKSDYRFRFRAATTSTAEYYHAYPRGVGNYPWGPPYLNVGAYTYSPLNSVFYRTQSDHALPSISSPAPARDECGHVLQVLRSGYNYTDTWDDSLTSSEVVESNETGAIVAFCSIGNYGGGFNSKLQVDWVFISSFVSLEPAHGCWSMEEGSGIEAPSPAAFAIWGTQDYVDDYYMGGDSEQNSSEAVSGDIYNSMTSSGRFGSCSDYWGFDTQPDFVYGTTCHSSLYYDDAWVFYKGHSSEKNATFTCPDWLCDFPIHRGLYDCEGFDDSVLDFEIFNSQYYGGGFPYRFVFLWTCGYGRANETGEIDWHYVSGVPVPHSWGMMTSWLGTNSLLQNGYTNNGDNSGLCFISFEPYSAWFKAETDIHRTYGDFASKFYYYLSCNETVRQALYDAALFAFGTSYSSCPLNQGYSMPDPRPEHYGDFVTCYMQVWGDGGITLPSS
jgi:hypothetical protein